METSLITYEGSMAIAEASGTNYIVTAPTTNEKVVLERDVDFMTIPGTKQPSITKSGSEKIIMAYKLLPRMKVESAIEEFGKEPFFFYRVSCSLIKVVQNAVSGEFQEIEFCTFEGSANTKEKRNGFNDAYNASNSTLKMAQKRAMSASALAISGLSSMFTQDLDNESFMSKASAILEETPESPITAKQVKRIYALFADKGMNQALAKQKLATWEITSTKQILQKDYDNICKKIMELT